MEVESIRIIEDQIIEEFAHFEDWMDKYNYIIEMGKDVPKIDPDLKTDNNLISGCQSRVWLHAEYKDGIVLFSADSEAVITRGLASLLIRVMNKQTPEDILNSDFFFVKKLGLKEHLSPNRSNGLVSMIKQMKLYALAFQTKASR
ncbi:MAG: Fe-S metabolism protein SufE [Bacteroidetes bacterium HGW-Bacteroidetes-17]|jgi:cysteine desulfuration protein SufE|nr:MAG: Fe-S metabolism protein SufE [Bacteroidetes bacterium HGW-Bacteroidetes-17]